MKSARIIVATSLLFFSCATQPFVVNYFYGPVALATLKKTAIENPQSADAQMKYCKTLTQFTYAFIHQEAEFICEEDLEKCRMMMRRARDNYLEALDYGHKALEIDGESQESLYYTAVAVGLYIGVSKNDFRAIGKMDEVGSLAYRALAIDSTWNDGAIYELLCNYEASRTSIIRGSLEQAEAHYEKALCLSGGKRASVFVTKAESICVQKQNRKEFENLLKAALSVPAPKNSANRLADKISKKRARWLLSRVNELFF